MIATNIETEEYYKGYLNINKTKEYIKKIDNKYRFFVYSEDHMYDTKSYVEIFDDNNKSLGVFTKSNRVTKEETKEIEKQINVFQYNYNFYLLPIGRCVTLDEIQDAYHLVNPIFNIKEDHYYGIDLENCLNEFFGQRKTIYYREHFNPCEICLIGHSRHIHNITNKKLFNLDIKEYTKRKNDFIKENPRYERQVENIYLHNIGFLCLFWNVNKKQLLKDNFDKSKKSIEKLNRKITNKIINS